MYGMFSHGLELPCNFTFLFSVRDTDSIITTPWIYSFTFISFILFPRFLILCGSVVIKEKGWKCAYSNRACLGFTPLKFTAMLHLYLIFFSINDFM